MKEAVITFETSIDFYGTKRRNIPDACRLHFPVSHKLKHCAQFFKNLQDSNNSLSWKMMLQTFTD